MTRISIKLSETNMWRGNAIRFAPINESSKLMHLRITELDKEFFKMEEHLRRVVTASRKKINGYK